MAVRSLWLQEALAGAEDAPRLEGEERADVCIVGGGFTGLWTALRLKETEPSLDVVLVEADVCGGGPSGRNGGFVMSWWSKFKTLEKLCGAEEALRLAQASADAVSHIGAFCEAQGIDAHFREDGWLWAASSEAQIGAWDETVAAIEAPRRRGVPAARAGRRSRAGRALRPTSQASSSRPARRCSRRCSRGACGGSRSSRASGSSSARR